MKTIAEEWMGYIKSPNELYALADHYSGIMHYDKLGNPYVELPDGSILGFNDLGEKYVKH